MPETSSETGLAVELSPLACIHCSAEHRTVSGRVLPTAPFSQPRHLSLHFALLLYKHLQQQSLQDFTKGF